ncbi:MAG: hypothetical protein ACYSWP_19210, partial [Planctomycetota bacterium]
TAAIDIDLMRHSSDQHQRTLAGLLAQMQELRSGQNMLQSQINSLQTNIPKPTFLNDSWTTSLGHVIPGKAVIGEFGFETETKPTTLEDIAEQVQQINSLLADLMTSQDSTNDKSN